MIRLSATKAELTITETETITSGAQRVFECTFTVNSDWDGLNRTAVFRAGTKAVSVLLGDDNTAEIPWEVLQTAGITLRIGLYGTNAAGDVLPTVWADAGMICTGAYLGDDAYPPTPGAYEQLVEIAENAEKIAQSVRDDADAGKFDGKKGPQGNPGRAATISVGTVTTGAPETPADVTNAGTENAAVFDFVIPQGPPGKDAPQIDDTRITTENPWSSLKIIDTLCPEFSVSGNPVTCNPVEGYPLGAVVTLEPKQAGTGDPSPDNVRPITGRDSVKVTVSNESESRDYDLTLPKTIYGGTVDAVTGEGRKEWFTVILTGNEAWNAWVGRPNSFYTDIEGHKNLANDAINVFCSTFLFDLLDTRYTPYHFFSQNPGAFPDKVRLCFTFDETVTNSDLAKQWIAAQAAAGTPVTVCYKLATPEPFQAAGNQPIPALAGENTVYTDGNSLAVSGRSDPLSTIQTMQAQITALQDQATQGGTS